MIFLLLSAGCASYALNEKNLSGAPEDSARVTDDSDTGEEDPDDTGAPRVPAWFVVRADLSLVGGVPTAEGAAVTIEVVDEDLVRTDCVVSLATDGIEGALDLSDADGTVWWHVPVTPADAVAPCATLPAALTLGVGELHPDVRARLGSVGHDDIAASLYGAFLATGTDEIAAFGYAGTDLDLAGDDVASLPPPDGLYQLAPLYLVPLPE